MQCEHNQLYQEIKNLGRTTEGCLISHFKESCTNPQIHGGKSSLLKTKCSRNLISSKLSAILTRIGKRGKHQLENETKGITYKSLVLRGWQEEILNEKGIFLIVQHIKNSIREHTLAIS